MTDIQRSCVHPWLKEVVLTSEYLVASPKRWSLNVQQRCHLVLSDIATPCSHLMVFIKLHQPSKCGLSISTIIQERNLSILTTCSIKEQRNLLRNNCTPQIHYLPMGRWIQEPLLLPTGNDGFPFSLIFQISFKCFLLVKT